MTVHHLTCVSLHTIKPTREKRNASMCLTTIWGSSAALGPIRVGWQIFAIQDILVKNLNCRIRPDLFSWPEWVYQITPEDLQWSGGYVDPKRILFRMVLIRIRFWGGYHFDPVSILIRIGLWSGSLPIGQFGKRATPLSDTLTLFLQANGSSELRWHVEEYEYLLGSPVLTSRGNDYHRD